LVKDLVVGADRTSERLGVIENNNRLDQGLNTVHAIGGRHWYGDYDPFGAVAVDGSHRCRYGEAGRHAVIVTIAEVRTAS